MKIMLRFSLFLSVLSLSLPKLYAQTPGTGNILYVNNSVNGGNGSGNSWANAIPELADALKWARQQNNFTVSNPLKIYVAKGKYLPKYSPKDGDNLKHDPADLRSVAFLMVNNVKLYGGFDPENNINDLTATRIFGESGTILSGDLDNNDTYDSITGKNTNNTNANNAYNIIITATAAGTSFNPVSTTLGGAIELDGFVVRGAKDGAWVYTTINGLNVDQGMGGAIMAGLERNPISIVITNSTITGNETVNIASVNVFGNDNEAVSLSRLSASIVLSNSTIRANSSGIRVRGSKISANISLTNSNIVESGSYPVHFHDAFGESGSCTLNLTNSNIDRNLSSSGAIYLLSKNTTVNLINSSVSGNFVGMYLISKGSNRVNLTNSIMARNTGAAIQSDSKIRQNTIKVTNSNIVGNYRGIVFRSIDFSSESPNNSNSELTLINSSVINNGPSGVHFDGHTPINGSLKVYNSIILQNSSSYVPNVLISKDFQHSLVQGENSADNGNLNASDAVYTTANIFTNFANGDYTLKNGSPLIAKGSNALFDGLSAATQDLAGRPRVYNYAGNGTIDLGAYEYQGLSKPILSGFADINKTYGDAAFQLTAPASTISGTFVYASSNTSIATINGNRVTLVGAGRVTITATQAATADYDEATISLTLTVNLVPPGTALKFNGSSNYVNLSNSSQLKPKDGLSIGVWVHRASWSVSTLQAIVSNTQGGGYSLNIGNGDAGGTGTNITGLIRRNSGYINPTFNAARLTPGWHYIALTYDGEVATLYVDGAQVNSKTDASGKVQIDYASTSNYTIVGAESEEGTTVPNSRFFEGSLDELRIYSAALTATEIKAEMLGVASANAASLLAHYRFDTVLPSVGNKLYDISGKDLHGDLSTSFTFSGNSNWVESYAMVVPEAKPATNVSVNTFFANWSAPVFDTADSYRLDVATDASFTNPVVGSPFTVNGLGKTIIGLNPSTTSYYYRVRAEKASLTGQGVVSETIKVDLRPLTSLPGTALSFNGADNYVNLGNSNALKPKDGLSIGIWVHRASWSVSTLQAIVSNTHGGGYSLNIGNGDAGGTGTNITGLIRRNLGYISTTFNASGLTPGWHYIALTYDGEVATLYVDGAQVNSKTETLGKVQIDYTSTSNYTIVGAESEGGTTLPNSRFFEGSLDELRIYSAALSATEIKADMLGVASASAASLLAHYRFDTVLPSVANKLYDMSGEELHGDLSASFTFSGNSNWVESYAMVVPEATDGTDKLANGFKANWTAPSIGEVGNYFLDVATNSTFTMLVSGSPFTIAAGTTGGVITNLNANTTYYYRVRANKNITVGQGAPSQTIAVTTNKADQTITFNALTSKTYGNATFNLTATTSSGLLVSYTSSDETVATVSGSTVTIIGAGTATITASQAGNASYNAAINVQQVLTIAKANQTISFAVLGAKTTNSTDFALGATATSNLAVSYTSSDTGVAEVYQDAVVWKVKIKGEGFTNIIAKQAGNANYSAATDVIQPLQVIGVTLPVTLVSYTAKIEGNYAQLQWQTTNEVNNKGFVIYRSGDDKTFVEIGEVPATFNSPLSTYNFIDKQPLNGNNYYKLVQIDNNGTSKELGTRPVTFNFQPSTFNLYPNPTLNKVNVTFERGKYHQLVLSDNLGKVLQLQQIGIQAEQVVIDLALYPTGVYFINLKAEGGNIVKKVIKQ